nr:hypothetical protein [Candidatus Nitrosacidococcus tergens]
MPSTLLTFPTQEVANGSSVLFFDPLKRVQLAVNVSSFRAIFVQVCWYDPSGFAAKADI